MTKEHDSFAAWNSAQGLMYIRTATQHSIHACQPEAGSIVLDGYGLVAQHADSFNLERTRNMSRICERIVVSQDRDNTETSS